MKPETVNTSRPGARPIVGILSFVLAMVALISAVMIALTSLLPNFNPPEWIRVGTMAPLPFALVASIAFGVAALASRSGRGWAISGLAASALVIVGFVILLNVAG